MNKNCEVTTNLKVGGNDKCVLIVKCHQVLTLESLLCLRKYIETNIVRLNKFANKIVNLESGSRKISSLKIK